jgi:uncharacterized integral membrane protein
MSPFFFPLVLAFVAFVIYGGVVMPAMEIAEWIRSHRSRAVE